MTIASHFLIIQSDGGYYPTVVLASYDTKQAAQEALDIIIRNKLSQYPRMRAENYEEDYEIIVVPHYNSI